MKKIIIFLITLVTVTNISYASFPVTENASTEVVVNNIESVESNLDAPILGAPISGGTPVFGILSLAFSVLALVFLLAAVEGGVIFVLGSLVLSILSMVFGGIGFKKSLKGFAITGFILGCIEIFLWLIFLIAGTLAFASEVDLYYY